MSTRLDLVLDPVEWSGKKWKKAAGSVAVL